MPSTRSSFWLLAAIIAVVATAIYAPTWSYGYSQLDDNELILDQRLFLAKPPGMFAVFSRPYLASGSNVYYRPIVNLSLVINAQFSGVRPFGYHLTNGLFHALASVLLLALLMHLSLGVRPAFLAALFFVVHPVHAASVAWIPGRNDLLLGIFALGAFILLLKSHRRPGPVPIVGHFLCLLGALFSKETAVCLPLLFVACLFAISGERKNLHLCWLGSAWACALLLYFACRSTVITTPGGYWSNLAKTSFTQWPVLLSDIGKLALPLRLQVLATPVDTVAWPGWVVIVGLVITLWLVRGLRRGVVAFAIALMLAPSLMGLLATPLVVLENRLYLAVVGLAVLLGEVLRALQAGRARYAKAAPVIVAACAVALSIVTLRYSQSFRDSEHFRLAAIKASPHSYLAMYLNFGKSRQVANGPPASHAGTGSPAK
jgi:hypothetical protein